MDLFFDPIEIYLAFLKLSVRFEVTVGKPWLFRFDCDSLRFGCFLLVLQLCYLLIKSKSGLLHLWLHWSHSRDECSSVDDLKLGRNTCKIMRLSDWQSALVVLRKHELAKNVVHKFAYRLVLDRHKVHKWFDVGRVWCWKLFERDLVQGFKCKNLDDSTLDWFIDLKNLLRGC